MKKNDLYLEENLHLARLAPSVILSRMGRPTSKVYFFSLGSSPPPFALPTPLASVVCTNLPTHSRLHAAPHASPRRCPIPPSCTPTRLYRAALRSTPATTWSGGHGEDVDDGVPRYCAATCGNCVLSLVC